MAQIQEVRLVDDLDGSGGSETVNFGLDGTSLEIDLNEANAARLRDVLASYVAAARRVGRSTWDAQSKARPGTSASDRELNAAIRGWARGEGMKVSERGRIPNEVVEAYRTRGKSVSSDAAPVFQEQPATDEQPAEEKPKRARRSRAKAKGGDETPDNVTELRPSEAS